MSPSARGGGECYPARTIFIFISTADAAESPEAGLGGQQCENGGCVGAAGNQRDTLGCNVCGCGCNSVRWMVSRGIHYEICAGSWIEPS